MREGEGRGRGGGKEGGGGREGGRERGKVGCGCIHTHTCLSLVVTMYSANLEDGVEVPLASE